MSIQVRTVLFLFTRTHSHWYSNTWNEKSLGWDLLSGLSYMIAEDHHKYTMYACWYTSLDCPWAFTASWIKFLTWCCLQVWEVLEAVLRESSLQDHSWNLLRCHSWMRHNLHWICFACLYLMGDSKMPCNIIPFKLQTLVLLSTFKCF